jgi:hypothetical protein
MCPFQFRVASTLPLIGMAPSQFKRWSERQPTGSDRRWIAPDFRRRRIAGSAAHRRRGPETTHTHVSPARELRRQTEQVLLNVTRPNIPPLPPAAIPVKATASEKQDKHNDYENGCHRRLQKMHTKHFRYGFRAMTSPASASTYTEKASPTARAASLATVPHLA